MPEQVLRDRLAARWRGHGPSPDEVSAKVDGNDPPNGRFVVANSVSAAFTVADG